MRESDAPPSDFIINPELAIHTQLDDLNLTLADVLTELRVRPTGEMVPLDETQSGSTPTIHFLDPPLFGFSLTNDGANDLEYNVGGRQSWCLIRANETIQVDMRQPIIDRIIFRCEAAQAAAWRLTGIR